MAHRPCRQSFSFTNRCATDSWIRALYPGGRRTCALPRPCGALLGPRRTGDPRRAELCPGAPPPYGRFARAAPAVWRFAQAAPHRTALCPGGPPPYGALPKRPPAVRRFAQAAPHRTGALPRRPPPCGATLISRRQEPPGTRTLTRTARARHSGSGPGPGRCSESRHRHSTLARPPPHGS